MTSEFDAIDAAWADEYNWTEEQIHKYMSKNTTEINLKDGFDND